MIPSFRSDTYQFIEQRNQSIYHLLTVVSISFCALSILIGEWLISLLPITSASFSGALLLFYPLSCIGVAFLLRFIVFHVLTIYMTTQQIRTLRIMQREEQGEVTVEPSLLEEEHY